jgi:hypothetical protein
MPSVSSISAASSQSNQASPSNTTGAVPSATTAPSRNSASSCPTPESKSNIGVTAGSVIGGIAVLAFTGIIFYILKRSKRHENTAPTHNNAYPGIQQCASELDSYGVHEAAPSYYEGSAANYGSRVLVRGELDGQQTRVEIG